MKSPPRIEVSSDGSLTTLWQDIFYGFRSFRRSRASRLPRALGVGANTVIFTLIDAALLRPLPYPEAGR